MLFPSNPRVQNFLGFQRICGSLAAYWNYPVLSPFQLVFFPIVWEEKDAKICLAFYPVLLTSRFFWSE